MNSQIEEMFNAMDHDKSGSITFTDFVAGCLVQKQVSEAAVRTAFDRLDHSRSVGAFSRDMAPFFVSFFLSRAN